MTGQISTIQYPALFCFAGTDEMLRLDNLMALQQLLKDNHALLPDTDYVIDSQGMEWRLCSKGLPYPANRHWTLPELVTRVQQHFFALAQSCISKIQAPDVHSLILMIEDADEC